MPGGVNLGAEGPCTRPAVTARWEFTTRSLCGVTFSRTPFSSTNVNPSRHRKSNVPASCSAEPVKPEALVRVGEAHGAWCLLGEERPRDMKDPSLQGPSGASWSR